MQHEKIEMKETARSTSENVREKVSFLFLITHKKEHHCTAIRVKIKT